MKKQILYILILVLPFIGMILTNELVRQNTNEKGCKEQKKKCSWTCHNNTNYCKEHHVKLAKPYFDKIDPVYFGIINSLKLTGNYGLANIVFLVILFPLIMYVLLVKSISLEFEIRKYK